MTQTVNGRKSALQKQGKPGQRQQERLIRQARRRRRQRIWISIIAAVVVIAAAGLAYWQYQRYTSQQSAAAASTTKHTAATIGPKCSTASAVPSIYASTPKAGPTSPPPATGVAATNADGLQCLDLKVGSGKVAQQGSTVSVEYTGWLQSNGKKFDSSYDHGGQAFSVTPLGQASVIPGWNEGLVGMKAGGTRRIILPASLAYGPQGNQAIPPNATLIFDVTALSVQ
jgi:FKBP-type peptidyl-prolyl cis-trans isomerase